MKTYLSIPLPLPLSDAAKDLCKPEVGRLAQAGIQVTSPADVEEFIFSTPPTTQVIFLIQELATCEAIWMADGWQGDARCRCEHAFAQAVGIKVLNDSDLLDTVLSALYHTKGTTDQIALRTSAEIALDIADMLEATPSEVAAWLRDHGCATRVADGTVHWVVYDQRPTDRLL